MNCIALTKGGEKKSKYIFILSSGEEKEQWLEDLKLITNNTDLNQLNFDDRAPTFGDDDKKKLSNIDSIRGKKKYKDEDSDSDDEILEKKKKDRKWDDDSSTSNCTDCNENFNFSTRRVFIFIFYFLFLFLNIY